MKTYATWSSLAVLLSAGTFVACGDSDLIGTDFSDECVGCEVPGTSAPESPSLNDDNLDELVQPDDDLIEAEPVDETVSPWEELATLDDLDLEERERTDVLRASIFQGLDLGRAEYIYSITLNLQDVGVIDNYELSIREDETEHGLFDDISYCPFLEFYGCG